MNSWNPQNNEELERMLHAGMGRAILFLMNQDLSQYRDLILDSCLHNYAYDPQCEDTRAEYLYPLIRMSGEEDYYRREILQALIEEKDLFQADQLLDFAVIFARDGDESARNAIYEKLRLNNTDSVLTGKEQIIKLDGIKGLIFLLDVIGSDPELIEWNLSEYIIYDTEDISSIEDVRLALKEAAFENPNIATALASIPDYSPDWTAEEITQRREESSNKSSRFSNLSEDTTWEEAKNSPDFVRLAIHWSELASDEEILNAAHDLDQKEQLRRLWSHLRIFYRRPFPLDPDPIIDLIDHPEEMIANAAANALELIRHNKVRDLFYQSLKEPKWSYRAIGLLRSNYQSGDHEIIMNLLEKETDPDRLHSMCMGTIEVYEDNPVPEGMQPLLAVYEKTPCSSCRYRCIDMIQTIDKLPEWMVEECIYDARSETRELAAEIKQGAQNT